MKKLRPRGKHEKGYAKRLKLRRKLIEH